MTRISDLNRNQDLTDGDVLPIGAANGSTRGIAAVDAAKYFSAKTEEDIAPLIDEATQAASEATTSASAASAAAQEALQAAQDAESLAESVVQLRADLLSDSGSQLMVYAAPGGGIGRTVDTRLAEALYAADYGAKGDGVTDDTLALILLFTAAKTRGVPARLHAGTFKVSSTLPINGVCIVGALKGYFNRQGTTIAGDGTFDIIAQTTYTVSDLTCYIKNLRVTDGITGFNFGYMVNSIFENLFIERCTDGFRLGRSTLFGPLFNECININARDMLQHGVVIAGNVNCNNNIFRQGYWDGRVSGFYQEAIVGGTGAVNNVFQSVEMGGANSPVGAIFEGRTYATSIRDCYFEPQGTNIWFKGVTDGCSLDNNLYAGHFQFATDRSSLVEFDLISDVSINGGFIYHGNAANKQFTFLHADFSNEARYRDGYQFAASPKYRNFLGAGETTYLGLTNFIPDNYKSHITTSQLGVTLKRDSVRNCIEKTLVKEFSTISEWTTIITIPGAAQNFGHSLSRILVVMSCRNTLDYYLLGFELSVTLAYNSGIETISEHEKTIYGTSIANLVQYRTVISGSDVLLQVSPTSAIVDQCFITTKITSAGSHVGDII